MPVESSGGPPGAGFPGREPIEGGGPSHGGLPERGRMLGQGSVVRITVAPVSSAPSFSVLVRLDPARAKAAKGDAEGGIGGFGRRDGGGARETRPDVRLIWMGQRRVPGVVAGAVVRFEGMLSRVDGIATVYNPRYEIVGRPEEY